MYFNGTKCCSLVLCCLLSLPVFAKDAKPANEAQGLRKPLCFVENKGQVADQYNNPRNDIQYKLATPGMTLYIGNGQMHYQFKKVEGAPFEESNVSTYRMDVTLLGANPNAKVVASDNQEYYENYFIGQAGNQAITAHSWNKITYLDVYPGIDWVLYVKDNKVEYDFNVRPGGNVNDIKLEYGGATSLKVTSEGSLAAETPMGNISEHQPYAYEQSSGKKVAANFQLSGNIVGFEAGAYNGTLTIDPYLAWSTYFGGAGQDVATSIVVDGAGNSFVTGYTASNGLATGGAYRPVNAGGAFDAFVAKYNAAGALQFATYYGGAGADQGTGIALDNVGNIYFTGTTSSNFGIASGGAYHGAFNGGTDGFIVKLNPAGSGRFWATYYGGTGNDAANGIAIDAANNVYVTGQTASATLVSTGGAYQTALSGSNDAFIAKFNSGGGIQWSTYYGGTAQDAGLGIACDPSGNVFVTGQTNSLTNMASAGAYQTLMSGTNDAFIAKFTTSGTRSWGTYYGGAGTEQGNGIAFDQLSGNIAIVGSTTSNTTLSTPKAFQTTFGGVQDAFVAYFDATGARIWGSYYGGAAIEYGEGVCFDPFGDVVVSGATFSTSGIANTNSFQPAIGGDYDAFVAKINSFGQTMWNTYFGGSFYDNANGVACDANDQVIVAGYSSSIGNYGAGGISTAGSAQSIYGGGLYDGFVTKFKSDTFVLIDQPYTDVLVCAGGTLNVSYTVTGAGGDMFKAPNTFTVEMSDATGSFAAPTPIGSVVNNVSGTIACTIPGGTPPGSGYRIRIKANNPSFISPDEYYDITVVSSIGGTTATSNSPTCVGGDIDLFDSAPYTVDFYSWSGPLGFTSPLQNPVISSVSVANAGTYFVTTTHNGCPPSTTAVPVVVNTVIPPTPIPTASAGCAGGTISLFANPDTTAPGITYYWVGPSGFTSTMQNPIIPGATVANSGNYFVMDSLGGCPSSFASYSVTVMPVIPVSVTISAGAPYVVGNAGDTICAGTMVNFIAHPTNGGSAPTYQWMTGPGSPVVGAISNIWSSSTLIDGMGVYCVMHSSLDCPSPINANSNVIGMNVIANSPVVNIIAIPGVYVTPGASIMFVSAVYNAGIGAQYQWQKNGVDIPGATNDTFILASVTKVDTITLNVTSTMACAIPNVGSKSLIVGTNVGVASISASLDNIGLYPNPNNGSFVVKGELLSQDYVSFEVTNLLGQALYTGKEAVQSNQLNKTIDLQDMSPGVYILRLTQDGASKVLRFSVQR